MELFLELLVLNWRRKRYRKRGFFFFFNRKKLCVSARVHMHVCRLCEACQIKVKRSFFFFPSFFFVQPSVATQYRRSTDLFVSLCSRPLSCTSGRPCLRTCHHLSGWWLSFHYHRRLGHRVGSISCAWWTFVWPHL